MLVLDNTLLSDYLDGEPPARGFLEPHEREEWAVSSIVLYEALMGSVHGYIDASPGTLREAITTSMSVLSVTGETATEAVALQEELQASGVPADHPDVLIAASAREHGGTFATAEKHFWQDDVRAALSVAEYDPH